MRYPRLPIGSEKISNNHVYIKVSLQPNLWKPKQRFIWEEAHGPIPEGHKVNFVDGNIRNFDLSNLALRKCCTPVVGAERLKDRCVYVKVAEPDVWRRKHHLIWEEAHGPIPEGHRIYFKDGNKMNIVLSNLALKFPPVGTEKIRSNKYIYVKVAEPDVWRAKHHLIWEEAHGPIPEGDRIYFIDGNIRNCDLSNLALKNFSLKVGAETISRKGFILVKVAKPDVWRYKHHIIWEAANGPIPEGQKVCFADKDKRNFALKNLVLKRGPSYVPEGTERKYGYYDGILVKTESGRWRSKHCVLWEEAYGKIPNGKVVVFADGDKNNFNRENLVLVSKKDIMYLSSLLSKINI